MENFKHIAEGMLHKSTIMQHALKSDNNFTPLVWRCIVVVAIGIVVEEKHFNSLKICKWVKSMQQNAFFWSCFLTEDEEVSVALVGLTQ